MKHFFILLFAIFFLGINAQTYVVPKSTGELIGFNSLWDKDKFFGYIEIHKDELIDKTQKFSFIVLDPDFKKISEGKFSLNKITNGTPHIGRTLYNNGKIIINLDEYNFGKGFYLNDTFVILDVATGSATESKTIQNNNIVNPKDFVLKNQDSPFLNYGFRISRIPNSGFIINEVEKKGSYGYYKNAIFINLNGEKIWQNKEIATESKDHFYEYTPLVSDEKVTLLYLEYYKNKRSISDNMLILDTKTGEQLSFKPIEENDYLLNYIEEKIVDDYIFLIGEYFKKNQDKNNKSPFIDNKLGLYRYKINKTTGEIISKNYLPFTEMSKFVDINENGRIKKEGILLIRSFEIRPDGNNVITAETYRPESILAINTYTELFSIQLNGDFKLEKMQSHNVNNSAGSKYAYTQVLSDNSGISSIFITNEVNQEKMIFLNEIIYNDNDKSFVTRKMQIQKNDEDKYFMAAKPGYIVLKEQFYWGKAKKLNKQAEFTLKKIETN